LPTQSHRGHHRGQHIERAWQQRRTVQAADLPDGFQAATGGAVIRPGASVALIARHNIINANLLFKWRHQYLEDADGLPAVPAHGASTSPQPQTSLLPVAVIDDQTKPMPTPRASTPAAVDGVCEVEFDHARLRIRGDVSPVMLAC
jgi:transposase